MNSPASQSVNYCENGHYPGFCLMDKDQVLTYGQTGVRIIEKCQQPAYTSDAFLLDPESYGQTSPFHPQD